MTALLLASTGGHLADLIRLRPRLEGLDADDVLWVTFDSPQSRSALAGENVVFVRHTAPRDFANVLRNSVQATKIFRRHRPSIVITTGSGVALSFLPIARAQRLSCHYIENSARILGPSLTGRLLERVPGVQLYSQYPELARGPWQYGGSVFDGFAATEPWPSNVNRLVVMLGQIEGYPFRRLVERLLAIIPEETEVLWQTGTTDVSDLPITGRGQLPEAELRRAVEEADVVVAHAGSGSSLLALESGRLPVLVPRTARHREHVDDHQQQIAAHLERRGLALKRSIEQLAMPDLMRAAAMRVEGVADLPPFRLTT